MIIRTWRGSATKVRRDDYPHHFHTMVLPELEALPGFRGAMLMRRETAEGVEFLVLTEWETLDHIKVFAGERHERAVVDPTAKAMLERYDDTVTEYEVLVPSGAAVQQP
jgi:heme-degrading monooxygenase HmoA